MKQKNYCNRCYSLIAYYDLGSGYCYRQSRLKGVYLSLLFLEERMRRSIQLYWVAITVKREMWRYLVTVAGVFNYVIRTNFLM